MNSANVIVTRLVLPACIFALSVGCEQKQQTYNEAVQLYAAEMTELERLEARQTVLLQAKKGSASSLDDLQTARELVDSVVGDSAALREATKGLIDPSLQGKADKTVEDNLKKINDQLDKQDKNAEKLKQDAEKMKEEAERELPELEKQIEKQKARVESARKAKEALAP